MQRRTVSRESSAWWASLTISPDPRFIVVVQPVVSGNFYNKFLAKPASSQRKPNGQFVVTPAMGLFFIASLPVARFRGVGPATAAKLQGHGIRTGADLRRSSLAFCSSSSANLPPDISA